MDARTNPYSPGAGRRPTALVGRQTTVEAWDTAIARIADGRDAQPVALYGLRGMGKTVLLRELRDRAVNVGWTVAQVEAQPDRDLRALLVDALEGPLVDLARPSATHRMLTAIKTMLNFRASIDTAGALSLGLDLSGVNGSNAASGNLEGDLQRLVRDLSAARAEDGSGVAILVDEAQDLELRDLAALNALGQFAALERQRLVIVVAGLPSLPAKLAEARTYAERLYEFVEVTRLSDHDGREAILAPARSEGVAWQPAAVDAVLASAAGYPYFLQAFASAAWAVAAQSPITLADVEASSEVAINQLDKGFFLARWDRATASERDYMVAMTAGADDGCGTTDVADRLGTAPNALSPRRSSLIAKGLIYASAPGRVAFTVPHMSDFIARQAALENVGAEYVANRPI